MSNPKTILRIDASMRHDGSVTRRLADQMVDRLLSEDPGSRVVTRDLAKGLPQVDAAFVEAKGAENRDPANNPTLKTALDLIEEIRAADEIVIGLPVYNFSMPAAFKTWIDLVALPRETFRYTADGPEGLLEDRPVHVLIASGGTGLGSEIDFLTPWLRHILGFIGLEDVRFVAADKLATDPEETIAEAERKIALAA